MAVTLPTNLTLGTTPPWWTGLQTQVNLALATAWNTGQRTRNVAIAATDLLLTSISPATAALLDQFISEYRAGGWTITLVGSTGGGAGGQAISHTYEFARWPA